jgi:hypothetical protein
MVIAESKKKITDAISANMGDKWWLATCSAGSTMPGVIITQQITPINKAMAALFILINSSQTMAI